MKIDFDDSIINHLSRNETSTLALIHDNSVAELRGTEWEVQEFDRFTLVNMAKCLSGKIDS